MLGSHIILHLFKRRKALDLKNLSTKVAKYEFRKDINTAKTPEELNQGEPISVLHSTSHSSNHICLIYVSWLLVTSSVGAQD